MMTLPYTIQQGLKLGGIPWGIKHYNAFTGNQVHTIGRIWVIIYRPVSSIYVKTIREAVNSKRLIIFLSQCRQAAVKYQQKEKNDFIHYYKSGTIYP